MKKTPHALTRLFTLLLASLTILSISVAATGTAGSSSDPLVTLSYLNEKFLPELMTRVDEKLAARTDTASKELRAQVDADIKRLEEKYGSQTSNEGAEHRHGGQLCGRHDDERTRSSTVRSAARSCCASARRRSCRPPAGSH